MNITLSSVSSAITCNSELYQKTTPVEILDQVALGAESAGVSNTRPDLKTAGTPNLAGVEWVTDICIPQEAWRPFFKVGDNQGGLVPGLDWARLVGKADPEQWRKLVMLIFPDRNENFFVNKDCNMKNYPSDPGYQACCVGEFGTKLAYRKVEDEYEWALTLPGTALRQMGTLGYSRLLVTLANDFPGVRATRLDFYVEDHIGRLRPELITEALFKGNYGGFRRKQVHFSDSDGHGLNGYTANLGSRESDSYWRCYHTQVKHGYSAMRLERELKGDKASSAWHMLKTLLTRIQWTLRCFDHGNRELAEVEIGKFLAKMAISGFDFIDRSEQYDNGSLENCELLPWWKEFKEEIGTLDLVIPKVKPSLQRAFDWLHRQVKKTLKKLKEGLGVPTFVAVLKELCELSNKCDDRDAMEITILKDKGRAALAEKYDKNELANEKEYLQWQKEWQEGLKALGIAINLTPGMEPITA